MDHLHDLPGTIGDLLRFGVVQSVDLATGYAVVRTGDVITPPLRWGTKAGGFSDWCPPSAGEQVLLACPEGDIEAAIILCSINSNANPPAGSTLSRVWKMPDGTTITYDAVDHKLSLMLAAGSLEVTAPSGITLTADITVNGKVTVSGDLTANGVSLHDHVHKDVQPGAGLSGKPQ